MNNEQKDAVRAVVLEMRREARLSLTPQFEADQMRRWARQLAVAVKAGTGAAAPSGQPRLQAVGG